MMSWFKVELDQKTGTILKTTRVAAAEKDGRYIRYVEAAKKQDANDLALKWYAQAAARSAANIANRRKQIAAGLCAVPGCLQLPAKGCRDCAAHREKNRADSQRAYLRKIGAIPQLPPDPRTAAEKYENQLVARREYCSHRRRSQRLTVLRDVRAALFANRDLKAFTSWLNKRIKEEEKHVAALPPIASRLVRSAA